MSLPQMQLSSQSSGAAFDLEIGRGGPAPVRVRAQVLGQEQSHGIFVGCHSAPPTHPTTSHPPCLTAPVLHSIIPTAVGSESDSTLAHI